MNGDWLLLTQAALATMATNFSLAAVRSLCAAINALTRPLPVLSRGLFLLLLNSTDTTVCY